MRTNLSFFSTNYFINSNCLRLASLFVVARLSRRIKKDFYIYATSYVSILFYEWHIRYEIFDGECTIILSRDAVRKNIRYLSHESMRIDNIVNNKIKRYDKSATSDYNAIRYDNGKSKAYILSESIYKNLTCWLYLIIELICEVILLRFYHT